MPADDAVVGAPGRLPPAARPDRGPRGHARRAVRSHRATACTAQTRARGRRRTGAAAARRRRRAVRHEVQPGVILTVSPQYRDDGGIFVEQKEGRSVCTRRTTAARASARRRSAAERRPSPSRAAYCLACDECHNRIAHNGGCTRKPGNCIVIAKPPPSPPPPHPPPPSSPPPPCAPPTLSPTPPHPHPRDRHRRPRHARRRPRRRRLRRCRRRRRHRRRRRQRAVRRRPRP